MKKLRRFKCGSTVASNTFTWVNYSSITWVKDGLQLRVSKGVGFLENNNKIRIDRHPAYGVLDAWELK